MNRYLTIVAAACFYCSPGLAQIPTTEATAPETAKSKEHDPDRLICENVPIMGSKIDIRRACGTAEEWADWRRRGREWTEGIQRGVRSGLTF